ncbi:MAG TPA: fibronectin type III domain-containing protein, partial [Thermoanaerobaculia bacterium]
MRQRRIVILTFLALTVLASAAGAATHNVTVGPGTSFSPDSLTIQVGDTVTWTNVGGGFHDAVADNGTFSSGPPSSAAWTFSRTFGSAGTIGYHCSVHGGPGGIGMAGTIIVQGAGGGEERGSLRFSQATYTVTEGNTATITVQRVGGDDGAVSVNYSATAASASAADFTPKSGRLDWADNDDNPKTFTVATTNDTASEANETIQLTLSAPGGGASLGSPTSAVLTLQDNDGNPGATPAAPTGLQGMAHGTTEIMLTWTDASNNETGFEVEARQVGGTFETVDSVGANVTTATISGLEPETFYLFRVRAQGSGGTVSGPSNPIGLATLGEIAACVAGPETLCLNGGRFKAELVWR